MHKRHIFFSVFIFFAVAVIAYFCKFEIDEQLTSDLLTVMSIILGFTLTSISTLVGQEFSKKLHTKIDSGTYRKQTQLQTLAIYYKNSFLLGIAVIILLVVVRFIENCYVKRIMDCVIFGLSADNLLLSFLLLKILVRSLLETK